VRIEQAINDRKKEEIFLSDGSMHGWIALDSYVQKG